VGCGVADEQTPRASSGTALREILQQNQRFMFSLIHKFNQEVKEPYIERDDIIVMSDEAHRTQAGKFARNMRLALPNASFIGFTGTPLFKHDHLTRRIFGGYVSRYDFKRAEEDQSTVKLVYENRGEKLGIARLDLNDRIAEKIEQADLDPDQGALLEKLLGKDYEVITAGDRLDKLADDFVEHCSTRWETGKSMLVCIDKITCARMFQRIEPRWRLKLAQVQALILQQAATLATASDPDERERLVIALGKLRGQAQWMVSETYELTPWVPTTEYVDHYGNLCQRFKIPAGEIGIDVEVVMETEDEIVTPPGAPATPIELLPDDALVYLLQSRYCPSDKMEGKAREIVGDALPGYDQVEAIRAWIHQNIEYRYMSGRPDLSAWDILQRGYGVCRDFAHLAIALNRTFNVPARYITGHLPDVGFPDPEGHMDFHAYAEVYLGGNWFTTDARFHVPRIGRITVSRGLDAVDGAFSTIYGGAWLSHFQVYAYQVAPGSVRLGDPVDLSQRLDNRWDIVRDH